MAPTADLVLFSRLGPSYRPEHLQAAVERALAAWLGVEATWA